MAFNIGQFQEWMEQARRQYEALQQKMNAVVVESSAGAGMVKVRMNGQKMLLELKLEPEVARTDPEMLAELVLAAVNEASRRVDERLQGELGGIASGLLPSGLGS